MDVVSSGVKSTGADPDEDDANTDNIRQEEIDRFNSTIYVENGKRVFSYYWQVSAVSPSHCFITYYILNDQFPIIICHSNV